MHNWRYKINAKITTPKTNSNKQYDHGVRTFRPTSPLPTPGEKSTITTGFSTLTRIMFTTTLCRFSTITDQRIHSLTMSVFNVHRSTSIPHTWFSSSPKTSQQHTWFSSSPKTLQYSQCNNKQFVLSYKARTQLSTTQCYNLSQP